MIKYREKKINDMFTFWELLQIENAIDIVIEYLKENKKSMPTKKSIEYLDEKIHCYKKIFKKMNKITKI